MKMETHKGEEIERRVKRKGGGEPGDVRRGNLYENLRQERVAG